MSRIIVFGAGGRVGRAAVVEAVRRGHEVTAGVRSPDGHPDLAATGAVVVGGDATSASDVARLARGHDAAVNSVYDPGGDPARFFAANARALVEGLGEAGVGRLVHVGLASVLPTATGALLMDTPDYPREYRAFFEAHAHALEVLRGAGDAPGWTAVSPAGDFDWTAAPSGGYRTAAADADSRIAVADFALAVLDEAEAPGAARAHVGVEGLR